MIYSGLLRSLEVEQGFRLFLCYTEALFSNRGNSVDFGMLVFTSGSLGLLGILAAATFRSTLLLRRVALASNPLLQPADVLLRILLILVCLTLGVVSGLPRDQFGLTTEGLREDLLLGVLLGALAAGGLAVITTWAVEQFGPQIYSASITLSILPKNHLEWLLVPGAFIPAVLLEEALFRSLLIGGFASFVSPWVPAMVFSAIFGLMHAPQGRLGIASTAAVSLVLSAFFIWRESLTVPLVAHYTINVLQLVIASRTRQHVGFVGTERSSV